MSTVRGGAQEAGMSMSSRQVDTTTPDVGPRAERTRALLLDTARAVFLERGYGGTRVDDIADAAATSRATFYTYFPSKRDVFLAAGRESAAEAERIVRTLPDIRADSIDADLGDWVTRWLGFLAVHGAFTLLWGQASYDDEEMRVSGVRTQIRMAKIFAETLVRLGHPEPVHADSDALAIMGMMERLWYYHYVAQGVLDPDEMRETIVRIIVSLLRDSGE